jgi:hypothetical protein
VANVAIENALRSAWRTFLQTFLGIFLISLSAWLLDVVSWAQGGVAFPQTDTLAKAAISATAAAFVAAIAFVQNGLENKSGKVTPGMPRPVADPPVVPDTSSPGQ